MATTVAAPIVLDERGIAFVEGTATKVTEVVLVQQTSHLTADELQRELPHLTLAQVHGALSYYYGHKQELDAQIQREFEFAERLRQEAGESAFARRMRSEGKLPL